MKSRVHFGTEGVVNPSEEFQDIQDMAEAIFAEACLTHDRVWLVYSRHWASEGYWIEFVEPNVEGKPDWIVKYFDKTAV